MAKPLLLRFVLCPLTCIISFDRITVLHKENNRLKSATFFRNQSISDSDVFETRLGRLERRELKENNEQTVFDEFETSTPHILTWKFVPADAGTPQGITLFRKVL